MHWIPLWYACMYEAQSSEHVKQKQQQYKQVDWGGGVEGKICILVKHYKNT